VVQRCSASGCRPANEQVVGRWAIWSDRDRLYVYDRIWRQRRSWVLPVPSEVRNSSRPPLQVFANPESLVVIAAQGDPDAAGKNGVAADVYYLALR
jgi:hypothetical protein